MVAVDGFEAAQIAVVLDDGGGLGFEGLHAFGEDCLGVVRALNQIGPVNITNAKGLWRLRVDVVVMAGGADATAGDSVEKLLVVDHDADGHDGESAGVAGELRVEPSGL